MITRRRFIGAGLAVGTWAALPKRSWAAPVSPVAPDFSAPLETIAFSRLAFGARAEDRAAYRAIAKNPSIRFDRWLELQLHPERIEDMLCEKLLRDANLATLSKPIQALWADHVLAANAIRDAEKLATASPLPVPKMDENQLRQQPARELEIATWLRAVYSKHQLKEVMVDFWHDHFSVYAWDNQISPVFGHFDREVIREHAFGNFREFLEAVAKSPAMLVYLDNFLNQSGNPNENFARELFELHTLGVDNYLGTEDRNKVPGYAKHQPVGYVDGDVYEAARCFTGWRIDNNDKQGSNTGEFYYYDTWHDRFQKIVLGRAIAELQPPMKDGRDVLDRLASHPGTAQHLARKLCQRLVSDEPSAQLVAATAQKFLETRNARDQIRQVVRLIASSEEFKHTFGSKLKRPFECTAGMLRSSNADFFPSEPFLNAYQRAGQKLFNWRTPDGYPDSHLKWAGTTPLLERWRLTNQVVFGNIDRVKIDLKHLAGEPGSTPEKIAAALGTQLIGRPLSRSSRESIVEALSAGRDPSSPLPMEMVGDRMSLAVALVYMTPEFQYR